MRIPIFKAGTHRSMSGEELAFSEADLKASAEAYDPALHEAPIVVGHPRLDAPAYGWVGKVEFSNGEMRAEPEQVDPAFAELVKAGRFKKVSASFYRKGAAGNPNPEVHYLRHVGFLGAAAPAVKGLKPVEFAAVADGDIIEFSWGDEQNASLWRSLRDWIIDKFSLEDADKVVPPWAVELLQREAIAETIQDSPTASPSFSEELSMHAQTQEQVAKQAALDAREASLATKEQQLSQREAALKATERKSLTAAAIEYADALVKDGRILPRFKPGIVALLTHLPAGEIEFAEGDEQVKKPAETLLRDFLDALPPQIEYAELSKATGDKPKEVTARDLAKRGTEIKADAEKRGTTMSFSEAINQAAAELEASGGKGQAAAS